MKQGYISASIVRVKRVCVSGAVASLVGRVSIYLYMGYFASFFIGKVYRVDDALERTCCVV